MKRIKLLVVEDMDTICAFVKKISASKNVEYFSANSGEAALPIFEKERPQIIILDIQMPGIGGIETLKRMRQVDKEAFIMMVTGQNDQQTKEDALRSGANLFYPKPVDVVELNKIISDQVARLRG